MTVQGERVIRLRFLLWAILMLLMVGALAWRVLPTLKIETDILALLPTERGAAASREAVERFSQALAGKMLFLVGAAQNEDARRAAQVFSQQLRASTAFSTVTLQRDDMSRASYDLYQAHRSYLLSSRHQQLLQRGLQSQLLNEALRAAYTPTGLIRIVPFAEDPLGLASEYLLQQVPVMGAARLVDGELMVAGESKQYVLITAELNGSPFATELQEQAQLALLTAQRAAEQAVAPARMEVVMSGAMPHAAAARERATDELGVFGALETVLVVLLLVGIFSAVQPLLLAAVTLTLAFAAGICAVHFVFGSVHVLALVFGSSLIGGVIDYSIHFFADRFRIDNGWTPAVAVRHVGGAILLGLITTVLGYMVLLMVPFPGLRQIALFCVAGLSVGCGTVLCAYPLLYRAPRTVAPWGPRIGAWLAQRFQSYSWTPPKITWGLLLLAMAAAGLLRSVVQDDVRALQASPPELVAAEQQVSALLRAGIESRYFLVQGDTEQAVLEAEQALTARLDAMIASGQLAGYTAVSRALPSLAQQQVIHQALDKQVWGDQGVLPQLLHALGFTAAQIEARQRSFALSTPLLPADWLATEAAQPYRDLWLGERHGQHTSIVTLAGLHDLPALQAATINLRGVRLVDRIAAVSDVLRSYRQAMSWLLLAVYLLAMGLLSFRYGWREAPLLLLPSLLASGVTLGLFGWLGVPINLFTLLALWLVLGLGVDYGIFLRHGQDALPTAVLSVSLSALTTLLAFGMLAFSATPFIHSIGLTLLCAISLSWLFVMLSCLTIRRAL